MEQYPWPIGPDGKGIPVRRDRPVLRPGLRVRAAPRVRRQAAADRVVQRGNAMIIDIHGHITSPELFQAVSHAARLADIDGMIEQNAGGHRASRSSAAPSARGR